MTPSYAPIRSLQRGLEVMQALKSAGTGPKTISELQAATRLPKPTLVRLLETLIDSGYVSRGTAKRGYYLTSKTLWLSDGYGITDLLVEAAAPMLSRLCRDIGWPSDLMIFAGDAMVVCDTNRADARLTFDSGKPGTTRGSMLFSAAGRAYLAFCSEIERRLIVERVKASWSQQRKTPLDVAHLELVLRETRRVGYAVRASGQCPETCAVASPIFFREQVVGCLNVVYRPRLVADWELEQRCVLPLKQATAEIAKAMTALALQCGIIRADAENGERLWPRSGNATPVQNLTA